MSPAARDVFADVDVLLTPTVQGEAPLGLLHGRSPLPEYLDTVTYSDDHAANACGSERHASWNSADRRVYADARLLAWRS